MKFRILASRAQAQPYCSPISGGHAVAANERPMGCNDAGTERAFSLHIATDWQMSCCYMQQHHWIIGEDDTVSQSADVNSLLFYHLCPCTFLLFTASDLHDPQMENLRLQQIAAMQSAMIDSMSQERHQKMCILGSVPFRSFGGAQNQW